MPKPNNLFQLQACLAQSLNRGLSDHISTHGDSVGVNELDNLLVDSDFTSEQLISIHRNNYVVSLKGSLQQLFPATQALVGNRYFAHVSHQFIDHCPLTEPHLDFYGGAFANFIKDLKALKDMPFVAQMAELEWHLDRISDMHYVKNFDFQRLSEIDESQVMGIHFSLATTCYLLSSDTNLIALHEDLSAPKRPGEIDHADKTGYRKQSYILVLQNQQGDSAVMPLTSQHWRWLQGLTNGLSLSQLCEIEQTELSTLMKQITDWIALGCIDTFSLKAAKYQPVNTNPV